jgi:hypothetical protein
MPAVLTALVLAPAVASANFVQVTVDDTTVTATYDLQVAGHHRGQATAGPGGLDCGGGGDLNGHPQYIYQCR